MRKLVVLGMGVCLVLAFASCKSSESAYKKAYEKAKQQELAEPQVEAPVEVTPVVAAPVTTPKVADTSGVRQEKVTVVSGNDGLKDYSVVAGSFGVKANAEGLKDSEVHQGDIVVAIRVRGADERSGVLDTLLEILETFRYFRPYGYDAFYGR